jgi:hypothetical protein
LDAQNPAQKFFLIKYYFFFMPNFQQTEIYAAFKKRLFWIIMVFLKDNATFKTPSANQNFSTKPFFCPLQPG